jgi:hypothetical protein
MHIFLNAFARFLLYYCSLPSAFDHPVISGPAPPFFTYYLLNGLMMTASIEAEVVAVMVPYGHTLAL